jgi:hypothetical protein
MRATTVEPIRESPGHWFEVDNGDLQTKRALTLVAFVLTLADTGSLKKPPLVTLPAL